MTLFGNFNRWNENVIPLFGNKGLTLTLLFKNMKYVEANIHSLLFPQNLKISFFQQFGGIEGKLTKCSYIFSHFKKQRVS